MMKDDETEERQDVHDVYSDDSLSDWSTVFLVFSIKYLQLTMENKKEGESRVESSQAACSPNNTSQDSSYETGEFLAAS